MTIKRFILIILTLFAVFKMFLSLGSSLTEPQIQSQLELYQTNFVLHGAELKTENLLISSVDESSDNSETLTKSLNGLLGKNPYSNTEKQYEKIKENTLITKNNYQKQLETIKNSSLNNQSQIRQLETLINKSDNFLNQININLGILQAQQDKVKEALNTWENLPQESSFAPILIKLWQNPHNINDFPEDISSQIENNLNGWFRYRVFYQYYEVTNQTEALISLEENEQTIASQAVFKLLLLSGIPAICSFLGLGLIIILLIQLAIKKENSILAINEGVKWETPWDGETIWFVFIVGFFCIQQLVLPFTLSFIFQIFGVDPSGFTIKANALYVLITYLLMTVGGLSILYYSIQSFFPLPEDWFSFKYLNRWYLWGIGGYFVALPLVLITSLINQQFWQGQGGSNDLLFLALQAQDKLALSIFFFTASIAAPFFEEIMFRGFLLSSLTKYIPVWASILISALIFALAHLSLSEVLPLMVLGIILGFVYTRSRNLLAPMMVHCIWNSGTLFGLFLLGSGVN
jgi:uncharacterized protein